MTREPLHIRSELSPGKASMPLDQFLAVFGRPGDGENAGPIRAELQRRGLLSAGGVDPHLAYTALQEWRTRTASTTSTRATTAPPKRRTRSLQALLTLDLEPDDPSLSPAEQRLLDDHHSREYWSARLNRR